MTPIRLQENKTVREVSATGRFRAIVVSHTHWDREWYLTQKQFQFLLGDTLDAVIDAVEHEPGFHCFMADGQTSVIHDYLEIRPHRRAQVEQLIRNEQLIIGPWYTMPDFWLPSGEALIRNLLRGRLDCERLGAKAAPVGYAPDSFGHIEQMPQILNGFGIDNYFFSRGKHEESPKNELAFWWHGADRHSRVVAHKLPEGYANALMLPTNDALGLRDRLEVILEPYREHDESTSVALLLNGIDHIWVQRDLPQAVASAGALNPAVDFEIGTLESFHRAFLATMDGRSLPHRTGCLRDACVRADHLHGTWSSRIDNKLENARAAAILEGLAEPAAVKLALAGGPMRRHELAIAWQSMLQNHAHDSICGCSMDAVHRDVAQRFRHVEETAEMIVADALRRLAGPTDRPILVRQAGLAGLAGVQGCCEFIVDAPDDRPVAVLGPDDRPLPTQMLGDRRLQRTDAVISGQRPFDYQLHRHEFVEHRMLALLPDAQPLETQRLTLARGPDAPLPPDPVKVTCYSLENALIKLDAGEDGTLTLLHKPTGRVYHRVLELIDDADAGGGYMFKPLESARPERSGGMEVEVEAVESGPIRGTLVIRGKWALPEGIDSSGQTRASQRLPCDVQWRVSIVSGCEQVDCRLLFHNRVGQHRVRLNVPLPFHADEVDAERAFVVAHEKLDRFTCEPGQNAHAMRDWVAVSDGGAGLAFVGSGLHEYALEDADDDPKEAPRSASDLRVTLLRSVPFVDNCGSWRTPDGELRRELRYEFSLLPFAGDWRAGKVAERAARCRQRSASEVFGDYMPDWHALPHASIRLEEHAGGAWKQVSSHRSVWRRHFGERDGWRTLEPDSRPVPTLAGAPVSLEGEHLLLSCVKPAERGPEGGDDASRDIIIRFYSLHDRPQMAAIRFGFAVRDVWTSDLAESPRERIGPSEDGAAVRIGSFEVVTLRVRPAPLGKTSPQDAKQE